MSHPPSTQCTLQTVHVASLLVSCSLLFFVHRLHGRYHELAPHLVPMDYTNDPDCKIPLALIVNMPELKVILQNELVNFQ